MKKEDFERLKAVCEKEGFECFEPSNIQDEPIFLIRKKKDIWDGVEFSEYIHSPMKNLSHFKIVRSDEQWLYMSDGSELFKHNCKPSTEQAYIEQLKKEAHERFGEIQGGDRFDFTEVGFPSDKSRAVKIGYSNEKWEYDKELDRLYLHGFSIYQQGKWATRVKERVEVEYEMASTSGKNYLNLSYKVSRDIKGKEITEIALFLASQLEAYLNR